MRREGSFVDVDSRYTVERYELGVPNIVFTEDDNGAWSGEEVEQLVGEFQKCYPDHSAWGKVKEKSIVFWEFDWDEIRKRCTPVPFEKQGDARMYRDLWFDGE